MVMMLSNLLISQLFLSSGGHKVIVYSLTPTSYRPILRILVIMWPHSTMLKIKVNKLKNHRFALG